MTRTIDLRPETWRSCCPFFAPTFPLETGVWVFGSRAAATARRYSDLDLALEGEAPLDPDLLGRLSEALSESDLTIKVDVIDLRTVDPAFRRIIEREMIPLPADPGVD